MVDVREQVDVEAALAALQDAEAALVAAVAGVQTAKARIGFELDAEAFELVKVGLLSAREREVLVLMAEGLAGRAIGGRLFISYHTVRVHIQNILAKVGVSSQLEAVLFAQRHGIVPTARPFRVA